jgi:peptidoglycan/LPS O-acetylase OafA/YrhL
VAFVHIWFTVDPSFNWAGYVMAVPAFLAISGFLVLQSYSESESWLVFIKKRALRVMPALLFSLLLCLVLLDTTATYNSFLNWLTGGLYTLPSRANGPLWSLAWEELAYLLLAILYSIGAYKRPIWIWSLWLISIVMVSFTLQYDPHIRIIFFLAPAFFTGNLMYIYRGNLLGCHSFIPWVVFYMMIQWRYVPDSHLFGGASLLLFQAFAVVWAGMAGTKIIPFNFPDISYGVYVYHFPIILFVTSIYQTNSLLKLGLIVSAILIPFSLISWYLIEKPALRFKPKRDIIVD